MQLDHGTNIVCGQKTQSHRNSYVPELDGSSLSSDIPNDSIRSCGGLPMVKVDTDVTGGVDANGGVVCADGNDNCRCNGKCGCCSGQ